MRDARKKGNGLKNVLIATTAVSCILIVIVMSLFLTTAKPSTAALTKAPEISIIDCPQFVSEENKTAVVYGNIYDSDSSCTLYINGEMVAFTEKAGDRCEWQKAFTVYPENMIQINFEVRDEAGNRVTETRTITRNTVEKDYRHADTTVFPPYPTYSRGTLLEKDTKDPKSSVRIREDASLTADTVDEIGVGDYVTYLSDGGNGWYYIEMTNGTRGYVSAEYMKVYDGVEDWWCDEPFYGCQLIKKTKHYDSPVNIRCGPGLEYDEIAELHAGERITFLSDYGNGWYYVEIGENSTGYISAEYVEVQ